MGTFAVGDVVVVPFPFADFAQFKKRPALVVAMAEFNNLILCQITSNAHTSKRAITLNDSDFTRGGLSVVSYARTDKLFTIEQSIIEKKIGSLQATKLAMIHLKIRKLFG